MFRLHMLMLLTFCLAAGAVAAGVAVMVWRRPDLAQPVFVALGVLTVIGMAVGWIISMR
ncbi:hypothetical protein [Streptomyces virginiae]